MPPSAGEDSKVFVRRMLVEVLAGREDPEGFFAMCVSALGHRETSSRFLPLIQPLSTANGALNAALTSIHTDYFSKTKDDELKLALSLSLVEMDDHRLSSTSQESRPQRPADETLTPNLFFCFSLGIGIGSVSHFMTCCRQNPGSALGAPLDSPVSLPTPARWPVGVSLNTLGLARMPRRKDGTTVSSHTNIRKSWDFSEEGASDQLEAFLNDGVYHYEKESGRADAPNTSCLSPYLHFGQLSPRWLLWDAKGARCQPPKFQRKLALRDLAYWQLTIDDLRPLRKLRECPELADLPDDLIHKPWKCPPSMLRRACVVFGQTYAERIVTDLEERRSRSLQDVALVRREFEQYVDKHSGCDLVPLPPRLVSQALGSAHWDAGLVAEGKQFLLPVITRMEFKHQQEDPDADAASNPYNTVLNGYVSRKRDETVAFLNERDFTASVMHEGIQRRERLETSSASGRARRTPNAKDKYSVAPSGAVSSVR
uniref:Uncharacterized protein n=1 Tax=Gasterosteus aculeatus aculeatus TaxID=481459 RepID=A0AAQ4S5X7_GASAC